jgi:hypothetical protein
MTHTVARTRRFFAAGAILLGGGLVAPQVSNAQPVAVVVSELACLPMEGNAPVFAAVSPADPGYAVRLYFQRQDHGDLYYVVMNPLGGGNYWAVLPKPERQNEVVEYHVTVLDPERRILGSTRDRQEYRATVIRDCEAKLSKQQEETSESLTIGETDPTQKGKPVAWFLCDGITHRIDSDGRLRADQFCAMPTSPMPYITTPGPVGNVGLTPTTRGVPPTPPPVSPTVP